MPDWSYQTLLRPVLFALRPETGRDLALGAMGRLASIPGGPYVIQWLGHMAPDNRLATRRHGIRFPSRTGLGCRVDPHLHATRAFAEFGLGFLEVGPISMHPGPTAGPVERGGDESLRFVAPQQTITCREACAKIAATRDTRLPLLARIHPTSPDDVRQFRVALTPLVDGFLLPLAYLSHVDQEAELLLPVFLAITAEDWRQPQRRARCISAVEAGRMVGVMLESSTTPEGDVPLQAAASAGGPTLVRDVRDALGPSASIIAAAGIHSPADALDALEAGADFVAIDSGLVFAGPGLPKRINEAVLYKELHTASASATLADSAPPSRLAQQSWFWSLLLGVSLFGGGVLAMLIAVTRVTLPYDEASTGLTRTEIAAINPRLLPFMMHDRVTLAGTMLALGLQYAGLAMFGVRRGQHWALVAVTASALVGFFTFFAFLGFGYFDPFHAFVAAILLQFTFFAMHARLPPRDASIAPGLHNNDAWRSHQWGQLLFIIHGVVLMVAGAVILAIGMTSVFVREDLQFLQTTVDALVGAHPQLKPLVAHDRATFGGMLLACGVATLLSAQWGFQRGQAWLWWTLMVAGNIAYLAALAVHMHVEYSSHLHLLPVYGGLAWLWAGGLFSFPYMAGDDLALTSEWAARLARP